MNTYEKDFLATNLTQNAIWLLGLGNGTLQGERWHRVS